MVRSVHEAKTHFSKYLARAAAGEEIILAKAGKPVAKLVPLEKTKGSANKEKGKRAKTKTRILGQYKGWVVPDTAFAPMTESEISDWYDGKVFP